MNEFAYFNLNTTFKSFYCCPKLDFSKITEERNKYLLEQADKLNVFFDKKELNLTPTLKYIKIIERINAVSGKNISENARFATNNAEEKFLLFIYTVDPNFEAAIIRLSENTIAGIKNKTIQMLGVYDPNLSRVELKVIKQFLKEEKKNEIYEKADKLAFK